MLKSHSVRAASTLKAKKLGITLAQILKKGLWFKESTQQKFYNKEMFSEATTFQSILVLGKKPGFGDMYSKIGKFSIRSYFNFIHKISITMQVLRTLL